MALSSAEVADSTPLLELTGSSIAAAEALLARAVDAVRAQVMPNGAMDPGLLEREQHAVHGLAWLATYVEALRQIHRWALRLQDQDRLAELERLILRAATGEYLARIAGGIPMSQGEIARLHQLHVNAVAISAFADDPAVRRAIADGTAARLRARLAALIAQGQFGDWGLDDDTLDMVREQFWRFAEEQIVPYAQCVEVSGSHVGLIVNRKSYRELASALATPEA